MKQVENLVSAGNKVNEWLRIAKFHLNVYLRVTQRTLNGEQVNTIDIASIEVDFRHQTQGHFTKFLTEIEKLATEYNRYVYVESILQDHLYNFLVKRGYKIMTPDERSLAKSFTR